MRTRVIVLSVALLAVSAVAAQAKTGPVSTGPCTSGAVKSTKSYRLALEIGGHEAMYSPAQVKASHPSSGEVMLGGEMSMMGAAPAGMRTYHVEVHICKPNGAVATKLSPRITIDDPMGMAGMTMTKLPVAIMQGVGEGISDYHYGNEVALTPGHMVTVAVTVNGQKAVFRARVPKS